MRIRGAGPGRLGWLALATGVGLAALTAGFARAAGGGSPGPAVARSAAHRAPLHLADTGLYSDFASRTVDARNLHYSPQYPLWSDGARKSRWIFLPAGTAIDARKPDAWEFPVGTRIWKEFAWARPVETRFMERTPAGWIYATYVWAANGSDAVLAPEEGALATEEVAPGQPHRIPSVSDCLACHRGGRAEVLGFGALQLSPDRDPLAPHTEPLRPGDVTLDVLEQRGLVRGLPRVVRERPPRIQAATPRGRALPPMPWQDYAAMPDGDLRAVFAYLRSIPPVRNRVPAPIPPPAQAAGGGPGAGQGTGGAGR